MSDAVGPGGRHVPDLTEVEAPGARLVLFGGPGLAAMAAAIVFGAWHGFGAVVLLAGLVAAIGVVARGWAFLSLLRLDYTRTLSANRAFPGDVVRLRARLDNRKPLPLTWVEVADSLPAALVPDDPLVGTPDEDGRCSLRLATPLGWYRAATLARDLVCSRRGYYRIGPSRLASTDVFGLFLRRREVASADILVVYPKLYPMADLGLPAHQPLGAGRDPRRLFDDPSRPMGLRPYTPETPFKAIAWKATARSGELQAKLYEPTVALDTALFLAVDSFPGTDDEDAFEMAVSTIASIADHDLGRRRPVGVFANGTLADGSGPLVVPPGRAPDQRTLVLESLARLERSPTGDFGSFLDEMLSMSAGRSTLAVVGGVFTEAVVERLDEQRRRGRPVILLVAGDGPLPRGPVPCRRVGALPEPSAA